MTVVARGESYTRIRRSGIEVTEADGTRTVAEPTSVVQHPDQVPEPVDLVLFCVKAYDTAEAAAGLPPMLASEGRVLCLQNGVRNEETLAASLGPERVLSGVLYVGARRTAPGAVVCSTPARIHFGAYSGASVADADQQQLTAAFTSAGVEATWAEDIGQEKWQKFLFNCALNPLTALLRQSLGRVLAQPSGRHLYGALLDEAIAVAKAHGAPIMADAAEQVWATGRRMDIVSSMAEDLMAGRPMEVDAFTGYVHELGVRYDVATPVSDVILDLLRAADPAGLGRDEGS